MNNIIKQLIIILLLSFTSNIYGQDLVITIPEQFSNNELPLPPFPLEVINKLNEGNYDSTIINQDIVRPISLDYLSYTYYPEFLDHNIGNNLFLSHTVSLESNLDDFKLSYLSTISNNNFSIDGGVGFNSDENIIDAVFAYSEYRLPVDISINGSLEDRDIILNVGEDDYFKSWLLEPGLDNGTPYFSLSYHDDRFIRPFINLSYKNNDYYTLSSALGVNSFRGGISILSGDLYPFLQYFQRFNSFVIEGETKVEYDYIDYSLSLSYWDENIITLGIGSTVSDSYTTIEPYIYISENFLLGDRVYKISEDDINLEFSFINDHFKSIISLNYIYADDELSLDLSLSYKVGKL